MNLLINFYFMYMRKHGEKGVDAARTILLIALSLNFITLFFFLTYYLKVHVFNFSDDSLIIGLLLMMGFGFGLMKYLDKHYVLDGKFKDLHLPKVCYLFMPLHYLGSVLLSIVALKYS